MSNLVESFSGIRGIHPNALNETLARKYATAFLSWFHVDRKIQKPKLIIGRDTRPSSQNISRAFSDAFGAADCEVIDVGLSSTPATENAIRHFGADGGVMITASHNPPEYNGWKLLRADGAVLAASDAEKVINNAKKTNDAQNDSTHIRLPNERQEENIRAYADFVASIIGEAGIKTIKKHGLTVLFDCGGGAIIPFVRPIAERVGIKAVLLNDKPGEFNRAIEPTPESLSYLSDEIKKRGADFAVGFDCDADRAEFVLPDGTMVSGQQALAIAVEEVLATTDEAESQIVVVNDATSDLVHEITQKHGAQIQEVEVGEINVVDEMKKRGSLVGGEGSSGGSIISPQTCRDGLLSMLIIARHLARTGRSLKEVLGGLTRYCTLNQKIKINPGPGLRGKLETAFIDNSDVAAIIKTGDENGGLKIRFLDKGWLWFRASRTEPGLVRIYAESKNQARAQQLLDKGAQILTRLN